MYVHGEHAQLANLVWDPVFYNTTQSAADSLAATKFLSKATFLKVGNNLRDEAILKFLEAEVQCRTTNRSIDGLLATDLEFFTLFQSMRITVESILGEIDVESFVDSCNWGPGASTKIRRRDSSFPHKFSEETRITTTCYDLVKPWFRLAYPLWDPQFEISDFSKIVTVPKNAKTDRTIAIEPGLNLWFQKGAGRLIRRRLRDSGIDLAQQSHNQDRSRVGSKTNHLATVDFSSASDTISRRLVELLLPRNWFLLLNSLRSSRGALGSTQIYYEKFSSMGNGFTFELESLIFFAAARAVCKRLGLKGGVSVYGDDVIIPTGAFELYSSFCARLGFTVNKGKSYSSGCYRESCGGHFWMGKSIKPIFLKEDINGKRATLKMANAVRRYSMVQFDNYSLAGCDKRFYNVWKNLVLFLGDKLPWISEGYGDIGLIGNFDEAREVVSRAKHGYEGYYTRVWAVRPKKKFFDSHGLHLSKLQAIGKTVIIDDFLAHDLSEALSIGNECPMPGRVTNTRIRVLVPRWIELGPWV
jgi:hypothetical protein